MNSEYTTIRIDRDGPVAEVVLARPEKLNAMSRAFFFEIRRAFEAIPADEGVLRGPNLDEFGPRFPDLARAYDHQLGDLAQQVAAERDFDLRQGVYVCLAGPSFETSADLRFLRAIGVDAVGMSTGPEVTVARHGGLRVLGISTISNKANLDGETVTTHEEVLAAGEIVLPRLETLIRGVLRII